MSAIFDIMRAFDCEELHFCRDRATGLRAIVAIHDTRLGAITSGGARLVDYPDEEAALGDALRLSQAMTQKCAACGAGLGGAKAVIWNRPDQKTPALLEAFGRFVLHLGGRFRTAVDYGLSHDDGRVIKNVCPYIEGESAAGDGFENEADTTALGLITAMELAAAAMLGRVGLSGLTVAVQGVGYVGRFLVDFLVQAGARVLAADVDPAVLARLTQDHPQVAILPPEDILAAPCDILAPCALGGALNPHSIARLRCTIICGAANNQLLEPARDAALLSERGIFYLPDFIVNAGGIIQACVEIAQGTKAEAVDRAQSIIGRNVQKILAEAERGVPPLAAALAIVQEALAAAEAC
ncbi:MAG: Glu/Leu/Phe/Val dehydrogenase dimerization domain-containing protein [Pseudomonadota bacterium]